MFRRGFTKAGATNPGEFECMQRGYLAWGDLCSDDGRHRAAEVHYRKALGEDERIGNIPGVLFALQRLGNSLIEQGQNDGAE